MHHSTNRPPNADKACHSCGDPAPVSGMEPFGRHAGRIVSWICGACAVAVKRSAA